MIDKWEALPQWLRWILYIPAVFLVPLIFSWLAMEVNASFAAVDTIREMIIIVFSSVVYTVIFVWLSIHLAPKANKLCAWLLFSFWSIFVSLTIVRAFYIWLWTEQGFTSETALDFLQSSAWFVTGIACLIYFANDLEISHSN